MSGNDSSAGNMSFAMGAALAGAGLLVGLAGPKFVAKIMTKLKPGGTFSKVQFSLVLLLLLLLLLFTHIQQIVRTPTTAANPASGQLNEGKKPMRHTHNKHTTPLSLLFIQLFLRGVHTIDVSLCSYTYWGRGDK